MGYHPLITRRQLLSACSILPAVGFLRGAQDHAAPSNQEDPKATFSTGVKVVNLLATVRDKKNQIVKNLTQNDFLLDEDGRPQSIKYFAQETNLPLSIGLLVDTSGSTRRVLPDEKSASYRFLQQVLREDRDLAFVIHFDFEVELLQDLTPSREKLEKALDELETSNGRRQQQQGGQGPGQGGGGYPGGGYPGGGVGFPGGGRYPRRGGGYPGGYPGGGGGGGRRMGGGGTALYDAVLLASDEVLKKQQGRKAIILLTDGQDRGSKVTLETAVEAAQRADTLVYSILFEDPETGGGMFGGRGRMNAPDGRKVLDRISRETGARFFEVSKKQTISNVFAAIEEDLRNQYNLGYTPDRADTDRQYRHIHLATKQKGLTVQTREGYYPS